MKFLGRLSGGLGSMGYSVALLVTLALCSAQAQDTVRFKVKSGSADYSQGGGTWMTLKDAKSLNAGDTIRTDDTGTVDLDLGKSGRVRLMPNTTLVIEKLSYENTGADRVVETLLDLKSGRIVADVPKLSGSSKYEVKTPNAVAGTKGAQFDINHSGCVVVVKGTVIVVCMKPDNTTLTRVVNALERFCCDPGVVEPAGREFLADVRGNLPGAGLDQGLVFVPAEPIQPPLSPVVPGVQRDEHFEFEAGAKP
jgi:hypothetical protein